LAIVAALGVFALALASLWLDRRLLMGRICLLQSCIVGMVFYRAFEDEIETRQALLYLALNMVSTGFAFWVSFGYFEHKEYALSSVAPSWLAGYALFLGFFFMRSSRLGNSWLLDYIGEISYSVYLLHPLFLFTLAAGFGASWLTIGLTIVLSLVAAQFSDQWIEKPGIQLGKNIVKRLHPS